MLKRKEERYILSHSKAKDFLKEISCFAYPKSYKTNYNHTIYFNNKEHEIPFTASIKARKYSTSTFDKKLNLKEKWILEIKKEILENKKFLKTKQREKLELKEIFGKLRGKKKIGNIQITTPLKPYIADSYRRRHYRIKKNSDFRITIDDKIDYFIHKNNLETEKIGNEDYIRVEIKIPTEELYSSEYKKIKNILTNLNALRCISKKDAGYNFLTTYLRNKKKRVVPQSNIEIEAKFSLKEDQEYVFHKIKHDFKNNLVLNFSILKEFPYTLESGKLHEYFIDSSKHILRISRKGDKGTFTKKGTGEIIKDKFGLNCIIKRDEDKNTIPKNITPEKKFKTIYRKRKYFLIENENTKNSYCILIDRSSYLNNQIYQIEIEGLLLKSSKKEKEIIDEIATISNILTTKYPILKPTSLTKFNWLKQLKC